MHSTILTHFDFKSYPPRPLNSIIYDGTTCKKYIFFQPNTGYTVGRVLNNITELKKDLEGKECHLNNVKAHIQTMELSGDLYDMNVWDINSFESIIKNIKKIHNLQAMPWNKLLAEASKVYQRLEDSEVYDNYDRVYPIYNLNTSSGRSKTIGFNIQGTTDNNLIRPPGDCQYLVHFDWVAADIKMASFMSGDPELEQSFKESDPYTYVLNKLQINDLKRSDIKTRFLSSFYSLKFDDPIFDLFVHLRKYLKESYQSMMDNKFVESILGKKFILGDNKLSTFNGQFQGSVAHAMQASLVRIHKKYPDNILTEVHDSIIMYCGKNQLKKLINDISMIMVNPLRDMLNPAPIMPLKVSIGKEWRKWKTLKRVNE